MATMARMAATPSLMLAHAGACREGWCRQTFDLQFVSVGVLAQRTAIAAVLVGKTFDLTGFVKPRQKNFALNAAMLAKNLEALLHVAANGNDQVQMAQRTVGKFCFDKPAMSAKVLPQTRPHRRNFPAEKPGGVHQMAAVART